MFDRGFGLSIDIDVVSIDGGWGFVGVASALPNHGDVRSDFGLSIADGGGFVGVASALPNRGDVRSGFWLSIDVAVLSIAHGERIRWRSLGFAESR
jgi:hypothetical protein